jgi:hypothetical protein
MSSQNSFTWSGRTQAGLGLFAASLIFLVVAAPNMVAIAFAIGAAACLALFGITGARLVLTVLTLLMLAVSAVGLFGALVLGSYVLLPVALAQIVAVSLIEGRPGDDRAGEGVSRLGLLSAWKRQRI